MKEKSHVIALVDCNNFFVSCERVFAPHLWNRPIVVLSSNDGCVVSRSKEAKELGIPMGVPYFQIRDWSLREGVAVFSSNFKLYGDLSRRVMAILEAEAVQVEEYSIDEAFLTLPADTAERQAREIREKVFAWTGIPVSIGIGTTKTLAKVAGDLAKKEPGGVLPCMEMNAIRATLSTVPVEEIWGIGRKFAARMRNAGLPTALSFIDAPDRVIQSLLGVYGMRIKTELLGVRCRGMEHEEEARKSITSSRSFGGKVYKEEELAQATAHHAARIAEKLRQDGTAVSALSVFIREGKHAGGYPYRASTVEILEAPTSDSFLIISAALRALARMYLPGPAYRKVGVTAIAVVPEGSIPRETLWGENLHKRRGELMQAMDAINRRYKSKILMPLAALPKTESNWLPRHDRVSPEYTTSWQGLVKVGAA